ncbi:protein MAIN-LIKE 2-like [Vicia villosa]|uniref:protein MAIN-LIKE 2-like n=1 Tax=Vicia villosa TaxID=3911 RepID=UPI00273B46B3|nr:protein MAIN-LIKE 2-like [Vicia villosa]
MLSKWFDADECMRRGSRIIPLLWLLCGGEDLLFHFDAIFGMAWGAASWWDSDIAWQKKQGERPVLKVASHGSKLKNFPERPMPEQVRRKIEDFHMMDFAGCSLTMLDASLLSAFVERWHLETSSFHLPFGEMTVTLDNVDSLFHLPIAGMFFTPVHRDHATVMRTVVDALEVDEAEVLTEFGRYQVAARMYMLHLVACTLFADKSGVYIDVHYLSLFSALDTLCWAWRVAALKMLYMALDVVSCPDTRQIVGYLSLLQCWIYEHFPHICERKIQRVMAVDPCAKRWKAKQAIPEGLIVYRQRVCQMESHVARHLPERCLRQYGYIQGIQRTVLEAPAGGIHRWFQSHIISSPREITDTAIEVQQPRQCQDGYLEWFHSVSHPRVIPPGATSDVPEPSGIMASSDPPPPPSPPAGD